MRNLFTAAMLSMAALFVMPGAAFAAHKHHTPYHTPVVVQSFENLFPSPLDGVLAPYPPEGKHLNFYPESGPHRFVAE